MVGDQETALEFFKKSIDLTMGRSNKLTAHPRLIPNGKVEEIVRVMKALDVALEGDPRPNFTYLTAFVYTQSAFLCCYGEYWKIAAAFRLN